MNLRLQRKSKKIFSGLIILILFTGSCRSEIRFGIDSLVKNIENLQGKKFALCVNHTSRLADGTFLADFLIEKKIVPSVIFTPEHGLRGSAGAGDKVYNELYREIPVVSLYGKEYSPRDTLIRDLDILIYDIQDVGLRFFTYISTLKRVAESLKKFDVELWIADRPNPLGLEIVEGPVLEDKFKSFVGSWNVPTRYGLTSGELLKMAIGEGWLEGVRYKIFPCAGLRRSDTFSSWQKPWLNPSPNLRSFEALKAYVGTCLWEGTIISEGRGSETPFLIFAYPDSSLFHANFFKHQKFLEKWHFTPAPSAAARYPKFANQQCFGYRLLTPVAEKGMINRVCEWIYAANLSLHKAPKEFFIPSGKRYFIDLLFGSDELRESIINKQNPRVFFKKWQSEADEFKIKSSKYWIYH